MLWFFLNIIGMGMMVFSFKAGNDYVFMVGGLFYGLGVIIYEMRRIEGARDGRKY